MKKKSLIILSYGYESEYYRAIFSLISFFAWYRIRSEEVNVIIYTDDANFFRKHLIENSCLSLEYFHLTPEILREMMGDTDYIHRRKVNVIDMTFKAYPDQDVIFIDSDTIFVDYSENFINEFQPDESYMHKREYTIEEGLAIFDSWNLGEFPKAFIKHISSETFTFIDSTEKFSKLDYSWNSGVLGISRKNAKYLPDVLKLTDSFYLNSKWFISEQLAFSFILQRKTKIFPAEKFVIHYWGKRQKDLMDKLIKDFMTTYPLIIQNSDSHIKKVIKKMQRKLHLDMMLEQAVIALSNKRWNYGILKAIQVLLLRPFDFAIYKEVYITIKNN